MKAPLKDTAKKIFRSRIIFLIFILVIFGSFGFINQAHAAWYDSVSDAVGGLLLVLGTLIAGIIGFFIMVAVYFVQYALQLNTLVGTNANVVAGVGISITLSLANFGFVTILIIIAIATILRRESYGVKALLAKLIIAALLVNFSLPIANSILQISNQFTYYFLSHMPGANGITSNGIDNFADSIGNAFQPQAIGQDVSLYEAGSSQYQAAPASNASNIISSLLQLCFDILFPFAIMITLIGLFLMLLIRFIYLTILLILMPLAWVSWITPLTDSQWKSWWQKFLKWTFFSPLVMMFLYIAMLTVNPLSKFTYQNLSASVGPLGTLVHSLGQGGLTATIMLSALQQISLIGIVVAGLFASDSLGVKFAGATIGAAKSVGKGLAKFTGKQGSRGLGGIARWKPIQSAVGAMQRNRFLQPLGTAIGNLAQTTTQADIEKAKKKYSGLDQEGFKNVGKSMENKKLNGDKIGYLQAKADAGFLTNNDKKYIAANKNQFSRYGSAASAFAIKINRQSIYDDKTLAALKDLSNAISDFKNGTGSQSDVEAKQAIFDQLTSDKMSKLDEDGQKELIKSMKTAFMDYNISDPEMAGEDKETHDAIQEALSVAISNNPTLYNTAVSKLDGASAANVTQKILNHQIDNLLAKGNISQSEAMIYKNNAVKLGNADDMEALLKKLRASGAEFDETATSILNANIGRRVLGAITGGAHYVAAKEPSTAVRKIG
ncbi:MAG: hypothetical protein M1334_03435 [Patescibacteria group bacterium]|nr:hypothetical protein [Patescibacteria group bacterium]